MEIFLQVVYTVIILGILILIHEFGHFITARLSGVKINEFAIGMGPTLFKFQGKETKYAIRLFPIGGFVSMEGEDEDSKDERAFNNKPVWKRMIIVVAGATMNLILGFAITTGLVISSEALPSTTVADFTEDAISCGTGLQEGDTIIKVGDKRIIVYTDLATAFSLAYGKDSLDITVKRDGETVVLEDVGFPVTEVAEGLLSPTTDFRVYREEKNILNILKHSVFRTRSFITLMYDSIADMVTGKLSVKYVSGPVGTSEVISQAAQTGWDTLLSLVALISINLAVVNLLPLPALDGGRFVFLLIELIIRKPVPQKFEAVVNFAGMVVLLGLMVVITFKDILFPIV